LIASGESTFPAALTTLSTASAGVVINPERHDLAEVLDLLDGRRALSSLRHGLLCVLRELFALRAPFPSSWIFIVLDPPEE
jgi:hypothetical protein